MLTNIKWLWQHRERPKTTKRCLTVWAKRILNFLALIALSIKPIWYRLKGAKIGNLVVLGKAHTEGNFTLLSIGDESSLGRCEMTLHEAITIGKRVVINDDVVLLTASHSLSDSLWRHKKKPIHIDDYAWIATGSIILPGVTIGKGAVVGAGSVVRENVPEYSVVSGNPATLTKSLRTRRLNYSPVLLNAPFEAWVGRIQDVSGNGDSTT